MKWQELDKPTLDCNLNKEREKSVDVWWLIECLVWRFVGHWEVMHGSLLCKGLHGTET